MTMVMYGPDGKPIEDNPLNPAFAPTYTPTYTPDYKPKYSVPAGGSGPVGIQTPQPQPSVPIVGGGAQARPPITGGPVGVQQAPQAPQHSEAWYYPQNVRARAAREQGGAQAPVQTPNTAQLVPGTAPAVQQPFPGKGQILNGGFGQMYPNPQQQVQPDPRVTAQRRYFRGNQQPQF